MPSYYRGHTLFHQFIYDIKSAHFVTSTSYFTSSVLGVSPYAPKYVFYNRTESWNEAQAVCRSEGGGVAKIETPEQLSRLLELDRLVNGSSGV